jgi:Na+-translocating ferredoxin:NAD+ oxidoreductase subunit B
MIEEGDIYARLAGKVNFPKSRFIRMVFQKLVTPEEGEMLLALPLTAAEFAAKYAVDEESAEQKLDEFARKGVSIPFEKDGIQRYLCVSNIIQVHDATIHAAVNKKYEPVPSGIAEIWRQFRETEWFEVIRELESKGLRGRGIPSWSTVKDHPELMACENLRDILKNAPAIGVVDCPCRWLEVQSGVCKKPTFVCLSLTPGSVKYIVDRGIGRQLTLEEGYAILDQCEDAGLIPTTSGVDKIRQLCFCETEYCIMLRPQVKYGYRIWGPSRFAATVDADLCTGCGTCAERCLFHAISLEESAPEAFHAVVDRKVCFGCGVCAVTCPTGALRMDLVRPASHILDVAAAT